MRQEYSQQSQAAYKSGNGAKAKGSNGVQALIVFCYLSLKCKMQLMQLPVSFSFDCRTLVEGQGVWTRDGPL